MLEGISDHCGGTESGSTGTVLSPNFPGNYPNNAGCMSRLTTRTGRVCSGYYGCHNRHEIEPNKRISFDQFNDCQYFKKRHT